MSSVDPLVELGSKYSAELWEAAVTIKSRIQHLGSDFSETVEQWKHDFDELKEEIREMIKDVMEESPLDREFDPGQVMNTFTWIGVLMMAMTVGGALGRILSPLVMCIIGEPTALLLALVLLPAFIHSILKKEIKEDYESDIFRRHSLLLFSFLEGFLLGFAFSARVLDSVPPLAALSAFAVGIPTQMYQDYIENNRNNLISLTMGAGLAAHLLFGFMFGFNVPYILLALLYTAIALVVLQLHIKNVTRRTIFTHIYQFAFICAVIYSQTLVYTIFGRRSEEINSSKRADH